MIHHRASLAKILILATLSGLVTKKSHQVMAASARPTTRQGGTSQSQNRLLSPVDEMKQVPWSDWLHGVLGMALKGEGWLLHRVRNTIDL